jgi:hypothetical protein
MPTRSALTFTLGKQIADLVLAAHLPSCNTFNRRGTGAPGVI